MKILFLHGWHSAPGGLHPTYPVQQGHEVVAPKLPDDDFVEAVRIARAEFDQHQPEVVVGLSRGGTVAMNINSGAVKLVLLCPGWKRWGSSRTVKPGLDVQVIHTDRERNQIAGSLVALYPGSDPWHGAWQLGVGDMLDATVVRWVEKADRCGDAGGYLLALRPAALVLLCGQEAGRFKSGDQVAVRVTSIDPRHRKVIVGLVA